jgi:Transglycosylase SLT domain
MAEQIRYPIVGEDRGATRVLKDVGRESAVTAAQTRLLAESLEKEKRAATAATDALLKVEKAAALVAITERKLDEEARRAELALRGEANAAQKLGRASAEAAGAGGVADLVGTGRAGGLTALIGAGVALSPVIATVGVGLAGLAAAAYAVAKPIEKAAHHAGGLQANLHMLDAEQRTVAQGILGLGKQFDTFEQALKPEILGLFNQGLRIAGHLLHDVQPVAAATGTALNGVLASIDKEFASGTWQDFFRFMGQTAGPDIRLLGQNFTDLLEVLPHLLEDLQPLAIELLHDADAAVKVADALEKAGHAVSDFGGSIDRHLAKGTGVSGVRTFGDAVGGLVDEVGKLVPALRGVLPSSPDAKGFAEGMVLLGRSSDTAAAGQQHLTKTLTSVVPAMSDLIHPLGAASTSLADVSGGMFDTGKHATDLIHPLTQASGWIFRTGNNAEGSAQKVKDLTSWVTKLNTAETKSLDTQLAYSNSLITSANDAKTLRQALVASHGAVGLHTAAERASFAAANTYIADLENTAKQAVASGKGAKGAATAIQDGLPVLERAARHNKALWQEVQTLKNWLDKLRGERPIYERVHVRGQGSWTVISPSGGLPGGTAGGPFGAQGLFVRQGTTSTADDVVARVSKGELIVPAKMVTAGLVDHLRGAIPGFAAGGIVPSYGGPVAGLPPWGTGNLNASVHLFERAVARATYAGMRAAMSGGAAGPARHGSIPFLERLWDAAGGPPGAAHLMAAIAMAESGGNPRAFNPSGASGLWQILGLPFPGNPFDPLTNARMAVSKYRSQGLGAWEAYTNGAYRAFYDRGGWLRPGATVAVNNTGEPERVLSPAESRRGGGALVHVGTMVVQDATDIELVAQRLSFSITAAGLGS